LVPFTFISFFAYAQPALSDDPDVLFKAGDYLEAVEIYLKLEKEKPDDLEIKRRIGVCYLNIHDDKTRAIPYLAKCYNAQYGGAEVALDFGKALQLKNDWVGALACFNDFRATAKGKEKEIADHFIEQIENAKELMKHPVHVKFENLGKEVNTKWADYYPFVIKNESMLYFTSRRKESTGHEISSMGYFSADIFFSKVVNGQWTKAKNLGPQFNTPEDEECVGVTPDGKKMVIYVYHEATGSDLFSAEFAAKGKNFGKPVQFMEPVNTEKAELEGSYSADANTLIFTSDRKGGLGEADIYWTHKLPNGEWGLPQNLGPDINTKYNEGFPQLSEDGKTLYFTSQGHTSMGGYDIFRSHWDSVQHKWGKAMNIGFPINTTDDDMMYSLAGRGRDGYISAWKKGGFGDLDIYKVIFTDVDEPLTAVRGFVQSVDTTKKEIEATITLTDLTTKTEIETKDVNPQSGRYIFIVPAGKYRLDVKAKGFTDYFNEFSVYDKSDYSVELNKDIKITPIGYAPKPPPKKK
jgi:hypothetical protein